MMYNNRETIAFALTGIVWVGGLGLVALGIANYRNPVYLHRLNGVVDDIGGGVFDMTDANLRIEQQPVVFMAGGAVLMIIGFIGCCGAASKTAFCMRFYYGLMLLCLCGSVALAALSFTGRWGVDFVGDDGAVRDQFHASWLRKSPSAQREVERRLGCCAFDAADPKRSDAVWLGGCPFEVPGCFDEMLEMNRSHGRDAGFIWTAVSFVLFVFTGLYVMVDQADH